MALLPMPDADDTSLPVPESERCKYPSKFCGRARVRKSNGTQHRFCQYHRLKANTNQKRWTSVRRQQAAVEEQHRRRAEAIAAMRALPEFADPWAALPDPVSLDPSREPVELAREDLEMLHALFLDSAPFLWSCQPTVHKPHYALDYSDIAL